MTYTQAKVTDLFYILKVLINSDPIKGVNLTIYEIQEEKVTDF